MLAGFDLISKAETGLLTSAEAADFDATSQALAGGYLISFLATAVAFLAWLSRSVDNVPKLGGGVPAITPRWSIGWWFVPFANLFKPYQVIKDLSDRMATAKRGGGDGLVLLWWIAWVASAIAGTVLLRLPEPATLDQLGGWIAANLVVDVTTVAAAVLAILLVREIQARSDERAMTVGVAAAGPWDVGGQVNASVAHSPPDGVGDDVGERSVDPNAGMAWSSDAMRPAPNPRTVCAVDACSKSASRSLTDGTAVCAGHYQETKEVDSDSRDGPIRSPMRSDNTVRQGFEDTVSEADGFPAAPAQPVSTRDDSPRRPAPRAGRAVSARGDSTDILRTRSDAIEVRYCPICGGRRISVGDYCVNCGEPFPSIPTDGMASS